MNGPPFPGKHLKPRRGRNQKPKSQRKILEIPPWIFDTFELFHDDVRFPAEALVKTAAEYLRHLNLLGTQDLHTNSYDLPYLQRKPHADFLRGFLGKLHPAYTAMDASRPWLFYWCIAGLSFQDEEVSEYKERLIDTVRPIQNPGGVFGGGHGQDRHCAGTYAAVLALAAVDGLEVVDRKKMWGWLGTVKQDDGGFRMAVGANKDIRGGYCAMTIITLLNLPLELPPDAPARKTGLTSFTDKLGGIGGGPSNGVHGAYAFCVIACLSILDAPHIGILKYLDINALAHWLASTQNTPEEGFAGRQKKAGRCLRRSIGGLSEAQRRR
ncbi:CAAX farnesyltransferase (FTase) subunit beta [Elasticomyces elasticus]|nr:CAAX farnesyltransferase (FTase) subunit beta [Elasticomyces elasticus]KAK4908390.1 CAAX farnesyltransferase (FTase) subunit beta [Elasticomyces elasticus]KAK5751718.1 CAAX farnesyltransferase (FTase) subunit beta [Elasticomyces elasticus]